jgi:hypothetical protein
MCDEDLAIIGEHKEIAEALQAAGGGDFDEI